MRWPGPGPRAGTRTAWGAVRAVGRVELRRRWAGIVLVGLVAGLAGAVVIGAFALAARTSSAYSRLVDASSAEDARVMVLDPAQVPAVTRLPQVESAWSSLTTVGKLADDDLVYVSISSGQPRPPGLITPVPVDGRMPADDAIDEVAVDERFARAMGVGVGDVVDYTFLTVEEIFSFDEGFGEPDGPRVDLRVVGVVRMAGSTGQGVGPWFASPAFARAYAQFSPGSTLLVRLRGGYADAAAFSAGLDRLSADPPPGAEEFGPLRATFSEQEGDPRVRAARHAAGIALGAFALVTALAGAFAVGQALARHHAAGAGEQRTEAALGLTAAERVLARMLPALLGASVAAAVAVAGGLLAGWIEPLGALKWVEPDPGWRPDAAVTAVGGVATAGVFLALTALSAFRAGRARADAPEAPVRGAARLPGGPAAAVGVAFAFARGRGRSAVPVRTTLVGAVLGVCGVVAATTFGASLQRLDATPERYGWPADFVYVDAKPDVMTELAADPRVGALALAGEASVRAGGSLLSAFGVTERKGSLHWEVLDGRMPAADDEVALGPRLADSLDLGVGDRLEVTPPEGAPRRLRVVGTVLLPVVDSRPLGSTLALTLPALESLTEGAPTLSGLVRATSPGHVDALYDDHKARLELGRAEQPVEVANVTGLLALPRVLGWFLAALAAAALAHGLGLLARRRAQDVGTLRALGFTPGQVAGAFVTTALTTVAVALAVGVPLGLGVGRLLWYETAVALGVATDVDVPVGALLALVPAAAALAVLVAVLPSWRAARVRPARVLRAD
ncbi:ABC transporter permease [Motilibacter deserti]|uniref:ABC transporter permease n=1 Tax=Motilibacter deserti TaxID=2714956 RepID=A0ABX0GYH4_9ACTN|nr:ABC transporter permease [Motilibacter deserti]NHC16003.1 ABC transporter permease [Motilibacter deserti]